MVAEKKPLDQTLAKAFTANCFSIGAVLAEDFKKSRHLGSPGHPLFERGQGAPPRLTMLIHRHVHSLPVPLEPFS